ncbi:LysR family transcriptional regulator [Clostridioides difficile]|nr:LysR family transcriptional regulator [Clostridioides difficile]
MNFKHCIIFREVAKVENFTKAANNLFITQSAVSHAIRELENEAETKLFERLHKSVKLTKTGELLLQEILPILENLENVESRIKNLEYETPIHIASCITFAQIWLPQLIKRFQEISPNTKINVEVHSALKALKLLKQGKVDIAFIEGKIIQGSLEIRKFSSYELCIVSSPNYCSAAELSLSQLLGMDLLLRERGSAVRETFESAVTLQGYKVHASWESVDSQSLIEATKNSLGVSILPKILVNQEIEKGNLIQIFIPDFKLFNDITVVINKDKYKSASLEKLCQLI